MAETIRVKRTQRRHTCAKTSRGLMERCEIFTFPTEEDRQSFITDLLTFDPELPYAVNMDPKIDEPERYLVAIPVRFYDWVTQGADDAKEN